MTMKAWIVVGVELMLSAMLVYILLGEVSKQSARADKAASLAQQRQDTIDDMQMRQRDVAALDAKYTGELADAKATIEMLRDDVSAGRKRLQLNARCPSSDKPPAPPAWMMSAAPDLLTPLNGIISPSENESKQPESK